MEEVIRTAQLARGVGSDSQRQVVGMDPFAIVNDADQVSSAPLNLDFDASGQSIDRVFQQLLNDTSGTLDHFPSCDLIDHAVGKLLDSGGLIRGGRHGIRSASGGE